MHRFAQSAIVLLALTTPLAHAATSQSLPAPGLAGHYYLQGEREVGSKMMLNKSGNFHWMLSYGAIDLAAQGTWHAKGKRVVLKPAPRQPGKFRLFDDSELNLRKTPASGTWVAIVGIPMEGPVADVEVRFESKAGKTATAVSKANGDAIVTMPEGEEWVRSGLRRAGTKDKWVWIDVPAERANARIAGFAVTNLREIQPPPFKSLTLIQHKGNLVIDDKSFGIRGRYERH
ncbi:hypothetical protein [Massilia niabensis]|uniref:DUF3108 domain-containing protein n=1 Tax=Massilia niabensis TaxID=544910 RepID=A0ABW0L8R5_9BURK